MPPKKNYKGKRVVKRGKANTVRMTTRNHNKGSCQMPFPWRYRVPRGLTWEIGQNLNNVGAIFANFTFEPSYVYNPTGTGAASIPFWAALSTIYRYYRAGVWTVETEFCNQEAFPVICYEMPANTSIATNSAAWQSYLSNGICKKHLLGAKGSGKDIIKINQRVSVQDYGGSKDGDQDDFYTGTTSGTAPMNNIYHVVGIQSPTAVVLSAGVATMTTIKWTDLVLFEEATPATFKEAPTPLQVAMTPVTCDVPRERRRQIALLTKVRSEGGPPISQEQLESIQRALVVS